MKLENLLPKDGPSINEVNKYIEKYKNDLIVIKYGGNVLIDRNIFNNFIQDISIINKLGLSIVVVHGGGPQIAKELKKSGVTSNFISGHRVTDKPTMSVVKKILGKKINNEIVNLIRNSGGDAVSFNHVKPKIIKASKFIGPDKND